MTGDLGASLLGPERDLVQSIASAALTVLMGTAAWLDLKTQRIPTRLAMGGLALALGVRALLGPQPLWSGLQGAALALAVGFVLFVIGAVGGGDAKLLGAVGAFTGPVQFAGALGAVFVAAMGVALVALGRRGLLPLLLLNTLELMRSLSSGSRFERRAGTPGALNVPYGLAIALGSLLWWFGEGVQL